MTDNEKAATFIGWRPDTIPCTFDDRTDLEGKVFCRRSGGWRLKGHTEPAPDMSDPRNYMKALEDLTYDWEFSRNRAEGHNCKIYRGKDTIYGSYPRDTLAALYDAEHSK